MENEIINYDGAHNVINFEEYAMSSADVLKQINVIQEVMGAVMHKDEHYGTIPGTNKPSLYKPGAEKLSLVFRLRPEYQITRSDMPNNHREYEVVCTLFHIPTGQSVGQGVGSATTMEGKYRYRGGEKESTGKPVPKDYWNFKNNGKIKEAQTLIGGNGFAVGKINGVWEICSIGEKIEHDNPADYYNTILKMAKKRAHVDAILTATAASDIFTQDIEDMPEIFGAQKAKEPAEIKKPERKKPENTKPELPIQKDIVTKIFSVDSKSGTTKNGEAYTIYTILDMDKNKYGTFSENFADIASSAKKDDIPVFIAYTDGKYGRDIVNLTIGVQNEVHT
jgi:hypothetical protein